MAIPLSDNIRTDAPKPSDDRFGPWASTAAACAQVPLGQRYLGLVVGVLVNGKAVDYVWENALTDAGLVAKTTGSSGPGLPSQAGHAGKYLRTDGNAASWAEVLPSQSGNGGRVLSTTGNGLVWTNPAQDSYTDGMARDAAGQMLKDSATIDASYTPGTQEARFELKPQSITAAHLHPDLMADGNLTPTQQAALSLASNWNGKAWNGNINGVPKNAMWSDGNYIYYFREDDYPVRSACV